MDGVIWRGPEALPGVPEFFLFLKERNIPYAIASNNATTHPMDYVTKVRGMGIPIEPEHIVTSALVTVDELKRHYQPGTTVYVVGSNSLRKLISEGGFNVGVDG